eukprot:m.327533 g.327533  ORF g.327533 m.327533 type:complete len:360 (-) comp55582_c0_seq8:4627-5706(-)
MRVFAVSDLHTDFEANLLWVQRLSDTAFQGDIILVDGDVSHRISVLRTTLLLLRAKFGQVFFSPGNHDLWVDDDDPDDLGSSSFDKLERVLRLCEECQVHTAPVRFGTLVIVPLFSWYHSSWDQEPDITSLQLPHVSKYGSDFTRCKWPGSLENGSDALASAFDAMNPNPALLALQSDDFIISFSHFLPFQQLLPEKRYLFYPHLPKMSGSRFLAERIRVLRSRVHVFGHTHINWDNVEEGIRCVQWPLAYPREQQLGFTHLQPEPFLVHDTENPAAAVRMAPVPRATEASFSEDSSPPTDPFLWTNRVLVVPRTVHDVEPAPWVKAKWPAAPVSLATRIAGTFSDFRDRFSASFPKSS